MALSTVDDVIEATAKTLGDVSSKVDEDGQAMAVAQALAELHWTLPVDDSFKEFWIIARTKRYFLSVLLIESANKFQYKKIYLQHRFAQYFKLLEFLDKEFQTALENNPTEFDADTWGNLGDYITNGFSYNVFGVDISYSGWQ